MPIVKRSYPSVRQQTCRFMVPDRRRQHEVLIEVVQNHTPQVIVVDEIGTEMVGGL